MTRQESEEEEEMPKAQTDNDPNINDNETVARAARFTSRLYDAVRSGIFASVNEFSVSGYYLKGTLTSGNAELHVELPEEIEEAKVFIRGHFGSKGELVADELYAFSMDGRRIYG